MSLIRNTTTFKDVQGTRRKGKKIAILKVGLYIFIYLYTNSNRTTSVE
jgi:hypothetical protein